MLLEEMSFPEGTGHEDLLHRTFPDSV